MLSKLCFMVACFSSTLSNALEESDRYSIHRVIQGYVDSWNLRGGKGFGDGFSEQADFVNIFGMKFSGRAEIEERHVKILQTIFKGSVLEVIDTQLREVCSGLVIAMVRWKLRGYRTPGADKNSLPEVRDGIFTHVFVQSDRKWEITASQNTMMPN